MSSEAIDLVFTSIDAMKRLTQNLKDSVENGNQHLDIDFPLRLCWRASSSRPPMKQCLPMAPPGYSY